MKKKVFHASRYTLDPTTGEISNEVEKHLVPSVLPMTGLDLYETVYVMALRNVRGLKKGDVYRLEQIYQNGKFVVRHHPTSALLPGLFEMDLFAEMLEDRTAKPSNDNAADKPTT